MALGSEGRIREDVDRLFDLVYDELRARAELLFRSERIGHTLQPTALVHETYLRLIDQRNPAWKNKAQFCAVAAMAMRRILVDYARRKAAVRRDRAASADYVIAEQTRQLSVTDPDDILFTHELIEEVRQQDETQAKIIELRFFGEMTVDEVAEALGWSKRAVEAEWTMIRALIRSRLAHQKD